jgi:hypothetical protein
MTLHTRSKRSRRIYRHLVLVTAVAATSWGCSRAANGGGDELYARGRIHVDEKTKERWDASEKEVEAAGNRIKPIGDKDSSATVPFGGDAVELLRSFGASQRHGAGDKRLLSVIDTTGGKKVVKSSGIVAEVTLVKGSEYKSENDFRSGWLPLAIVVLPPRSRDDPVVYPKLKLHGDTSWVYVRERADSSWAGAIVRIVNGKVQQEPLYVTASSDSLEPVIGARFMWEDNDESIWGTCGGKCCKMITTQPL